MLLFSPTVVARLNDFVLVVSTNCIASRIVDFPDAFSPLRRKDPSTLIVSFWKKCQLTSLIFVSFFIV